MTIPHSVEDFNEAWNGIHDNRTWLVSVADCAIAGGPFNASNEARYWQFDALQSQGLAWRWIEAATNSGVLEYTVAVDGICFAFKTPFGWSMIPLRFYAWGRLPKGFKSAHAVATLFLNQVLEVADDDGTSLY